MIATCKKLLVALAIVLVCFAQALWSVSGKNHGQPAIIPTLTARSEQTEVTPENTVFVTDATAGSFCRDFSTVLKSIRLEWVFLETGELPESVWEKNIILVGELDSEPVGQLIATLLTTEESDYIRQGAHYSSLRKASPWQKDRTLYISVGSNLLLAKQAAEETIASIMANAASLDDWYLPVMSAENEEAVAYLARFQHEVENDPLPKDALYMDFDKHFVLSISAAEATEDIERLFYLLSHGWAGYGYFNTGGRFEAAKENILNQIAEQSRWMPTSLKNLIKRELSFIHDCHLIIGDHTYCSHLDFWYNPRLEVRKKAGNYVFVSDGVEYVIVTINGESPQEYIFPSLNEQGAPIYRLGVLVYDPPASLELIASDGQIQNKFEIALRHSDRMLYRDLYERFGEERIGGIPVVRVRTFGDYYTEQLYEFLQTADRYKGEPYLILDIRGNSGGNDIWPRSWVQRFTGYTPVYNTIASELMSKATRMGRVNSCAKTVSDMGEDAPSWFTECITQFDLQADSFIRQSMEPYWTKPVDPIFRWIPNDTTIIVIMDGAMGSSGEGFIEFLWRQVENVILVGENSAGALTFGPQVIHRLPNSRLTVWTSIGVIIPANLEWVEESGLEPDLWVPAADALNFAVAAARNGTIATRTPLPPEYFGQFEPERPPRRDWILGTRTVSGFVSIPEVIFTVGLVSQAVFLLMNYRKKMMNLLPVGGVILVVAVALLARGGRAGYGLLIYALVLAVIGTLGLIRARWASGRPTIGSSRPANRSPR